MSIHVNNSLSTLKKLIILMLITMLLTSACSRSAPGVTIRQAPSSTISQNENQNLTTTDETTSPAVQAQNDDGIVLPFAPSNPISGGLLVAEYLAGGLANIDDCLPELVEDWKLLDIESNRCLIGDVDGDDLDEIIYLVSIKGESTNPGDVWFFDDSQSAYRLFNSARAVANEILSNIKIEGLVDITGDDYPEAIISSEGCNGEICTQKLIIASAHRGLDIENLSPKNLSLRSINNIILEDINNDDIPDIVIQEKHQLEDDPLSNTETNIEVVATPQPTITTTPNPINENITGPQRDITTVISWTGLRLRANLIPAEPEYLFHLVVDADNAYQSGDLETAKELYKKAANNTDLKDWKEEQGNRAGRIELQAYSLFRAAIIEQRTGNAAETINILNSVTTNLSNSIHGLAAGVYLSALQKGEVSGTACAETEAFLTTLDTFYQETWDYGIENPTHEIGQLCR